jgi:hypothetical protein
MGFAAHVRLCVISIVTPMLLGVGLGTGHVVLPFGWIPFAAVELVILVPAIRGYAAPAHLAHPFSKRKGWFRRSSSPRPSIAPADLAITAARPGLPNNHKSLAAKAAADAISADTHMTDYDKLIYLNALDGLTKADLAILEHFAAEIAVPLADLANGIPEPQDEESLGGLISSLRRLEAHGLVSIAIPERKQKIRSYKPHQYAGVNPWLLKVATIMPHGKKLIQLLKHGDTMFAQDRDGANQGAILNQAPSRLSLQ